MRKLLLNEWKSFIPSIPPLITVNDLWWTVLQIMAIIRPRSLHGTAPGWYTPPTRPRTFPSRCWYKVDELIIVWCPQQNCSNQSTSQWAFLVPSMLSAALQWVNNSQKQWGSKRHFANMQQFAPPFNGDALLEDFFLGWLGFPCYFANRQSMGIMETSIPFICLIFLLWWIMPVPTQSMG